MPTPSRGIRVTRRRAEELEGLIEVNAGKMQTRLDGLEKRIAELERAGALVEVLARARVAAEINVLQGLRGPQHDD